jgi:capsular polysaccharide biosynthesis protein
MYAQATLYDHWMALYSRKKIILAVSLLTMVFSLGISYYLPPIYEAKASLYMPINIVQSSFTGDSRQRLAQPALRPLPDEKEAGIHVGILKSDDVAEMVHAMFPNKSIGFFKKNVDFSTSPQFFTDIYVRDRDPETAAAIANAYVRVYAQFHSDVLKADSKRAQVVLRKQLKEVDVHIAKKVDEIRELKRRFNLMSSGEAEQLLFSQAQQLERDRNETMVQLEGLRERIGQGNQAANKKGSRVAPSLLSPMIEKLHRLEERNEALTERINTLQEKIRGTVTIITKLKTMEQDERLLLELRNNVERNLAEAILQGESPSVNIVQVQTARPPKTPGFPIIALNAIVGLVFGFAAACYVALLLEYLKRLRLERIRRNLDESVLQEAVSV